MTSTPVGPQLGWVFDPALPSGSRSGGNAAQRAFTPTLETLVREVLQNAKDAGEGQDVDVLFRLIDLRGPELVTFLDALQWNSSLRAHVQAAANEPKGLTFRAGLAELQAQGRLTLLLVQDSNTTGLIGSETAETGSGSKFSALCRDELYSSKTSTTAGGSHGMGKSVLWHFSAFSTVLFNSTLEPGAENAEHSPRFIGRAVLPWHKLDDGSTFNGGGWLGEAQQRPSRAVSLWNADATEMGHLLKCSRPDSVAGTSLLIVGFREPAEPDRSLDAAAAEIERATAKWFWPSLTADRAQLRVAVEVVRDGVSESLRNVEAQQVPVVQPFIEAVVSCRDLATVESLEQPGDVVAVPLEIELPAEKNGKHGKLTGSVTLTVRLSEPSEAGSELIDTVAYYRGPGMVVRYRDLKRLSLTARPFHAALICGEANGSTAVDTHVDTFLRAAEPPEHNQWMTTDDLKNLYTQGYAKALSDLERRVREKVRSIVSERVGNREQGPERLMKKFRLGLLGGGGGGRSDFDLTQAEAFLNDRGMWEFQGTVLSRIDVPQGWRANITVRYGNEDNATGTKLRIAKFSAGDYRAMLTEDRAIVMVKPNVRSFEFHGVVDPRAQAVDPHLATLAIAVTGTKISG